MVDAKVICHRVALPLKIQRNLFPLMTAVKRLISVSRVVNRLHLVCLSIFTSALLNMGEVGLLFFCRDKSSNFRKSRIVIENNFTLQRYLCSIYCFSKTLRFLKDTPVIIYTRLVLTTEGVSCKRWVTFGLISLTYRVLTFYSRR